MDDDGLMLNFAPASAAAGPSSNRSKQANGRGGRHAAQRQARQSQSQPQSKPQQTQAQSQSQSQTQQTQPEPAPSNTQPSLKRPRPSESAESDSKRQARTAAAQPSASSANGSASARPPKPKPTTFISSLFSGPPDANAAADHDQEEQADAARRAQKQKATNAPTDTSTFTGLGLDPLLVAHLKGPRMNIGNRPTGIQRTGLPALIDGGDESRDVLIHSQTGSGKTLTYLLPILQSLLPLCTETWIDRSVGTLAIILAPTRELARQIYEVTEKLCQLHLSLRETEEEQGKDDSEEASLIRRTRWLVPGLLSGGSTKNHEKSRLRKGIPILIATPGRLLDHLQNTSSFDVGKCRWLVLDEADRLFEMGFKDTLEGIIKAMDGRRRLAFNTAKEALQEQRADGLDIPMHEVTDGTGVPWWERPRKVVLCSATLDENVQMLAGTHLRRPQVVRGGGEIADPVVSAQASPVEDQSTAAATATDDVATSNALYPRIAAPAQLRQHAVIVPPKLRLVTLIALLRCALSRNASNADARRVIVFISSTDSVEFHWNALGGVKMSGDPQEDTEAEEEEAESDKKKGLGSMSKNCELFPNTPIYRLHGSLAQSERIASLKGFSSKQSKSEDSNGGAVLLCTSVAARGLDLPSVGCVIQLDAPTEGGVDEYLHRVGRTARVGKEGESYICLLPHEKDARQRLEKSMSIETTSTPKSTSTPTIAELSSSHILKKGFGGKGTEYESRATDVQLSFEKLILISNKMKTLARRGYLSFLKAYSTHPSIEKDLFHIKFLHLGHLAKSFALRETPDEIKAHNQQYAKNLVASKQKHPNATRQERKLAARQEKEAAAAAQGAMDSSQDDENDSDDDDYESTTAVIKNTTARLPRSSNGNDLLNGISSNKKSKDAEARMYAKVREMGRQIKSAGKLAAYGADEFQLG
ncbi:unnamed protein product [Sympodiomycopsis kandeliae]